MKKVSGFVDGIPIKLNVPETLEEYREGARLSNGMLDYSEGYLFYFGKAMNIMMENSGVNHDLALLYFDSFSKYGIVTEVGALEQDSPLPVASIGCHAIAVELRQDFVTANKITKGSFIVLNKDLNA